MTSEETYQWRHTALDFAMRSGGLALNSGIYTTPEGLIDVAEMYFNFLIKGEIPKDVVMVA